MKAIIYAGIGLFTAASVYGIADYYHSNEKGQLRNLYEDAPAASKESTGTKAERDIELEDYSRGKIDGPVEVKKTAIAVNNITTIEKNNETVIKKKIAERKAPKIKFSDFSRSALVREKPPVAVTDSSTGKY